MTRHHETDTYEIIKELLSIPLTINLEHFTQYKYIYDHPEKYNFVINHIDHYFHSLSILLEARVIPRFDTIN